MAKFPSAAGFWQSSTSALLGVIMAVGTLWAGGTFEAVSRLEVRKMINREMPNPYYEDRNLILSELEKLSGRVDTLTEENRRLGQQVSRMSGAIEAMQP